MGGGEAGREHCYCVSLLALQNVVCFKSVSLSCNVIHLHG